MARLKHKPGHHKADKNGWVTLDMGLGVERRFGARKHYQLVLAGADRRSNNMAASSCIEKHIQHGRHSLLAGASKWHYG